MHKGIHLDTFSTTKKIKIFQILIWLRSTSNEQMSHRQFISSLYLIVDFIRIKQIQIFW